MAALAGAAVALAAAAVPAAAVERTRTPWWKITGVSGAIAVESTSAAPATCADDPFAGTEVLAGSYRTTFRMTRVLSREPALRHEPGTGAPRTPVDPRFQITMDRTVNERYRTIDDGGEECVEQDAACEETSSTTARSFISTIPNTRNRPASRVWVSVRIGWSEPWLDTCAPGELSVFAPGQLDDEFVSSRGLLSASVPARVFKRKRQTIRIRRHVPWGDEDGTGTVTLEATVRLRRMIRACTIDGRRARCRDLRA